MEKLFIKNRKGQKVCVIVEQSNSQKGLVFIAHGLSGNKEERSIQVTADVFLEHHFTVVRFDTTNTFGESDGCYENATVTSYYEDLEDVISWATTQEWYQEPFTLAGFSLGGLTVGLFSQKYPEKVCALAPISPVISGMLSIEAHTRTDSQYEKRRKETGWNEVKSSRPGIIKRLPYSYLEDQLKYDLLIEASKLTMPVLLIVGERDTSTPHDHIQLFYDALHCQKELHIIENAPHVFSSAEQLAELKNLFSTWIKKYG